MADSRINIYHNLAIMLNAGLPIIRALQTVHKQGKFGRLFKKIEIDIAQGKSLTDIVQLYRRDFQPLDRTLISVGEQTGQTAEMFEMLSQWYSFRQRLSRTIRTGLLLPMFYIHAAAFLIPVVPFALGGWNVSIYLKGFLFILAIFYIPALIIFGVIYFTPKEGVLRYIFDSILLYTPVLGKGVRELALSRYAKVFAIMYKAGVPILECARMATESTGNLVIRGYVEGAYLKARAGEEMSKGFSRMLPAEFISVWEIGEESGDLDNSASRLGNMHAENADRRFALISRMLPFGIYLIVMGVIAYFIITYYMRIFSNISI